MQSSSAYECEMEDGDDDPTKIWTQTTGFRNWRAILYTIGPMGTLSMLFHILMYRARWSDK